MVILGVTGWTDFYRYMRAELLRIRSEDYITAARALGIPTWRLLARHAIPNGMAPILVGATFGIAGAIFLEAALAFLNLVQTPSWGELLNDGRQHVATPGGSGAPPAGPSLSPSWSTTSSARPSAMPLTRN